jgi:hypothetical protein
MVRYRKSIKSGVFRLPIELKEAFGDEIEIAPGLKAAAIYPRETDKRIVIKSLRSVIRDLELEVEFEKEKQALVVSS